MSSVSYRSPALLVKMATALDHAAAGRATLGIGAGWHETEHRAFGFAYPTLSERLDRLEEAAAICRSMLDGEPARLDGTWFTLDGATSEPRPRATLPLLVGGSGERRTLPIVARFADAWNGEGDPDAYARKSARLDALLAAEGRPLDSVRRTVGLPPPLVRDRRDDAVEALTDLLVGQGSERDAARKAANASPLVGTAEAVADRLHAYRAAGAEEAIFDWPTPSDRTTLEMLAGPVSRLLGREPSATSSRSPRATSGGQRP